MQIHELNSFIGNLDNNTFAVVDNGTDTGKISVPSLLKEAIDGIAQANERIDNIISSPAPSEAEIIDARQGVNGEIYTSLGEAIRTQFQSVDNNLDGIRSAFVASSNLFDINDPNVLNAYYLLPDGTLHVSTGGTLSVSGWIPVEPSTHYMIGANGTNYARYVTEYDAGHNVISTGGGEEVNITTTANTAFIRFTFRNNMSEWRMNKGATLLPYEPYYINAVKTDIALTDKALPANAKAVGDTFSNAGFKSVSFRQNDNLSPTFTDGYVGTNGTESSSQVLHHTDRIPVKEGDSFYTDGSSSFRFVAAYNAQGNAIVASGAESVVDYTVPVGIVEVILTTYKSYVGQIRYQHDEVKQIQSNGTFGYFRAEGTLAADDSLILPVTNVNKNIRQFFSGDISTFGKLRIGRKSGSSGIWAEIDSTNITIYRDNVADTPVPHGLTIVNNIQLKIITDNDGESTPQSFYNASITITSNGNDFTLNNINWVRTYNSIFAQALTQGISNAVLSWEAGDADKAIYIFGDSYLSWYPERWAYYLAKDGFAKNVLVNAYAGEPSSEAIKALRNVAAMGKPKYIVWCLGMNDGSDSSSAPSSGWAAGRDAVLDVCDQYGATPIFATIPTVPTIDNEQKNAWIRTSGYRFIDFAKAVGADSSGVWYSGMLENDGVHPTISGAKALYGRVLTDFPEISVTN